MAEEARDTAKTDQHLHGRDVKSAVTSRSEGSAPRLLRRLCAVALSDILSGNEQGLDVSSIHHLTIDMSRRRVVK